MKELNLKKAIRLAFLPVACATLLSSCAYEPMAPAEGGPTLAPVSLSPFDRLDTNRDGYLSRGEVEAWGGAYRAVPPSESAETTFQRLDVNREGFLSRAEAEATLASIPGASFDAWDMNRDGFLSLAEMMPHLRWLETRGAPYGGTFESYDVNRDGFLSRSEAEPLLRGHVAAPRYVGPTPLTFDRLDIDRSGFLSRAEAAPIANAATFDRFDTNRDGFLSRAEAEFMFRSGIGGTDATYGGTVYGPR